MIILALAFLTIIGLLTTALFGFAQTGSVSLRAFRLERTRRYNADAALQAMVQKLVDNPTLGVSGAGAPACGLTFPMQEDVASGLALRTITPNSTLTVTCAATDGQPSGGKDTDGGQAPRDVTIEVRCNNAADPLDLRGTLTCGNGTANSRLLAQARVRFDVDFGYPQAGTDREACAADGASLTPPGSDKCPPIPRNTAVPAPVPYVPTPPSPAVCNDANGDGDSVDVGDCTASSIRARVPKVVYWSIKG